MRIKTILIMGIGGEIAQSIATILNDSRPEVTLIGTDVRTDRHGGRLVVGSFFQIPRAGSNKYLESIKTLIKKHSVDVVIPTSEIELEALQPLIDELGKDKFITAGERVVEIGNDKLKTIDFIKSLDIPVPWTMSANGNMPISFPCILKPQRGAGSNNIIKLENVSETKFYTDKFPDSIFQEFLEPDNREITCAVYRSKSGKVAILQLLRELTDGTTSWATVIKDNKVLKMCEDIAIGLNLHGAINIQLRLTSLGPRVFEINPRFSSTVLMRHRLGFCDLLWALDEAQGENISFSNISVNRQMVRVQNVEELI